MSSHTKPVHVVFKDRILVEGSFFSLKYSQNNEFFRKDLQKLLHLGIHETYKFFFPFFSERYLPDMF